MGRIQRLDGIIKIKEGKTYPDVSVLIIPGRSIRVKFGAPGDEISTIIRSLENPPFLLGSMSSSARSAIAASSSSMVSFSTGCGFRDVAIEAFHSFFLPFELPDGKLESESRSSIAHLVVNPVPLGSGIEHIASSTLDCEMLEKIE